MNNFEGSIIKNEQFFFNFFSFNVLLSFLVTRRSQSFRQGPLHSSKRSQSQNAVNTSISAHPLLPIETGLYYLLFFY